MQLWAAFGIVYWKWEVCNRDFRGGPAVKTPCFHCRECGFSPWSGNPRSRMPRCGQKKTKSMMDAKLRRMLRQQSKSKSCKFLTCRVSSANQKEWLPDGKGIGKSRISWNTQDQWFLTFGGIDVNYNLRICWKLLRAPQEECTYTQRLA